MREVCLTEVFHSRLRAWIRAVGGLSAERVKGDRPATAEPTTQPFRPSLRKASACHYNAGGHRRSPVRVDGQLSGGDVVLGQGVGGIVVVCGIPIKDGVFPFNSAGVGSTVSDGLGQIV